MAEMPGNHRKTQTTTGLITGIGLKSGYETAEKRQKDKWFNFHSRGHTKGRSNIRLLGSAGFWRVRGQQDASIM